MGIMSRLLTMGVWLAAGAAALGAEQTPRGVAQLDNKALQSALKLSLGYMRSKDREARMSILRELRARSSEFPPEAQELLTKAHARQSVTLAAYVTRAPDFAEKRRGIIQRARRQALKIIFDIHLYPAGTHVYEYNVSVKE